MGDAACRAARYCTKWPHRGKKQKEDLETPLHSNASHGQDCLPFSASQEKKKLVAAGEFSRPARHFTKDSLCPCKLHKFVAAQVFSKTKVCRILSGTKAGWYQFTSAESRT